MLSVVGDATSSLIVNSDSGDILHTLSGHTDYSFATAWSPCGKFIATGNQDLTTRLYDVRNFSEPFLTIPSELAAVRSLKFNFSGTLLALAESVDYVRLLDLSCSLNSQNLVLQSIDFFGEVSGVSWTPDDQFLYIGTADTTYGSILEFEKSSVHKSLHSDL